MNKVAQRIMINAGRRKDWDTYYVMAWYLGYMSARNAKFKSVQKHVKITMEANYVQD